MAKLPANSKLSALAMKVLADHQRAPDTPFYDLFSLGSFFELTALAQLDSAYEELERSGLIERANGRVVSFAGRVLPMFRVRSQVARTRRRSA